ncbi:hypothetical protein BJ878DRAFT_518314 [Calycina marina]|uniref:Uncharacterized protein n=1 Tax=Calycina marina TaxID=1763456 RepID=A0A9P7YY07_9HELO|nr:hypothetical protein BJ878DRAFT_518314 [Calycina marina]
MQRLESVPTKVSPIMPPSFSHELLACLVRPKAVGQTSLTIRAFSTSTTLSSIGPESPKFIDVPIPPQRDAVGTRDIKGKLPSPRDVFHRRGPTRDGRTLKQHLKLATLPPSKKRSESEPANERIAWKRRMAESRRQNLRDGIMALQQRKHSQHNAMAQKSTRKQEARDARLNAPQREDERLTNPTITAAVRDLQLGPVADPQREQRVAEKKQRVEAKEAAREETRQNALHTLYMNARSFIVTEAQLDEEIERIFVERPFGMPDTIWDAHGRPEDVKTMLATTEDASRGAIDFYGGKMPWKETSRRMKVISEELTGGKIDRR